MEPKYLVGSDWFVSADLNQNCPHFGLEKKPQTWWLIRMKKQKQCILLIVWDSIHPVVLIVSAHLITADYMCVFCNKLCVNVCMCPEGTHIPALSQDPRTFQNTGTQPYNKQPRQHDLSTIHNQITQRHAHTQKASHMHTYESTHVDTWRWKIYLKECRSHAHKKTLRQMCTQKLVLKCVSGWEEFYWCKNGGKKTMVDQDGNKRGEELNNSKRSDETTDSDQWAEENVMEMEREWQQKWKRWEVRRRRKGVWNKHWWWMNAIFSFLLLPIFPPSFSSSELENKRHCIIPTGGERKKRERERGIVMEG